VQRRRLTSASWQVRVAATRIWPYRGSDISSRTRAVPPAATGPTLTAPLNSAAACPLSPAMPLTAALSRLTQL
jgi:hypothetical protein